MRASCTCGEVLVDNGDGLPFKAHFRPDEDDHAYADLLAAEVERVARRFRSASAEVADHQLRSDVQEFGMMGVPLERHMYECPRCGRLLVRRRGDEGFAVYAPETTDRDLLRSDRANTRVKAGR